MKVISTENTKQALISKLENEFSEFKKELLKMSPSEILEHTYEYTVKQEILLELTHIDFLPEENEALIGMRRPIHQIYDDYTVSENSFGKEVIDCIRNRAEFETTIKKKENIKEIPFELMDDVYKIIGGESAEKERLMEKYPKGTTVRLEYMEGEDPRRMYEGLTGIVTGIDDALQIHVSWENGSSLALNPDTDRFSSEPLLRVLRIEPGREPCVRSISPGLESFQREVDGYIECVYPWSDNAAIICNEDGKTEGFMLNRALRDEEGNIYDIIAGTFLVVGLSENDFSSLSDEQIKKFTAEFKSPELIFLKDGKIMAVPYDDPSSVPVYYQNCTYASENNEQDAYRASFKANVNCRKDIEAAISKYCKGEHPDPSFAFNEVREKYGAERVKIVCAVSVLEKEMDPRISLANKEWAGKAQVPDGSDGLGGNLNVYYSIEKAHASLLDMFVTRTRLHDMDKSNIEKTRSEKQKSKNEPER